MSFRPLFAQAGEQRIHIESAESADKERLIAVAALPGLGMNALFTPEAAKAAKKKQQSFNVFASFGAFGVKPITAAMAGRNTDITRLSKSAKPVQQETPRPLRSRCEKIHLSFAISM